MDIFAIIYKILRYLEKSLDYDELDMGQISNEKLRISYNRWEKILILMQENGYISGLSVFRTIDGVEGIDSPIRIKITIDGLEYLEKLEKLYACTNKNN